VLRRGIGGLKSDVDSMSGGVNRRAFDRTLDAFATFIRRHDRPALAEGALESFPGALQVNWFIQIFLRAMRELRIWQLHLNTLDADDLREAREHPERYPLLTVRVSGFSARVVALDEAWQDAIVERTERGM
jgi:hypothetical protein